MNCGIIAVGMGIILSITANFSEHCSNIISAIGKNLSIIGQGLMHVQKMKTTYHVRKYRVGVVTVTGPEECLHNWSGQT